MQPPHHRPYAGEAVSAFPVAMAIFIALTIISIGLTAATALFYLYSGQGTGRRVLLLLTLSAENNLGAWWSGMLLAVLALAAGCGALGQRQENPRAARGWAWLAAVLLFLSLDEVGSIHERLGTLGQVTGPGAWFYLVPLGIVVGSAVLRALWLLWTAGEETRRQTLWLLAGFAVLGSVAIQEWLEHAIVWETAVARAIRAGVEEGTELLGMLVLLRGCWPNLARPGVVRTPPLPAVANRPAEGEPLTAFARPMLLAGIAAAPILAIVTALLPDQHRGHPADWLAATSFLLAGLMALRPFAPAGEPARSWTAAAACLAASAGSVAVDPTAVLSLGGHEVATRLLVLSMAGAVAAAAWLRTLDGSLPAVLAGAVGIAAVALVWQVVGAGRFLPAYAGTQVLALGTLAIAIALAGHRAALPARTGDRQMV